MGFTQSLREVFDLLNAASFTRIETYQADDECLLLHGFFGLLSQDVKQRRGICPHGDSRTLKYDDCGAHAIP